MVNSQAGRCQVGLPGREEREEMTLGERDAREQGEETGHERGEVKTTSHMAVQMNRNGLIEVIRASWEQA